ncbi:6-cysteine protein [Plasmodium berghei]|uniref:6-cysteine protein n=1 Tax=Plasmodium berghei TaxID=5821 RepID=A0A1D3SBN1_PLABE|nr:6-cysteine protein [Plasmodium berghei]
MSKMIHVKNIITSILVIVILCLNGITSKKSVDLANLVKNIITLNASPGETVEFTCPYTNKELEGINQQEQDNFNENLICFEYISVMNTIYRIQDYVRGAYNIKSISENNVHKSEFTIPPIVVHSRNFSCYCYMEKENKVVRKVLKVYIPRRSKKASGCDFNYDYRTSAAITIDGAVNYRVNKVCDAYTKSGEDLVLLCPLNYSIKPNNCFTNVYVKNEDIVNNENELNNHYYNKVWDENNYKVVNSSTLFNNELITHGDKSSIFTKLPVNNDQKYFSCICQSADGSDVLMMNVYMNKAQNNNDFKYSRTFVKNNEEVSIASYYRSSRTSNGFVFIFSKIFIFIFLVNYYIFF